jgi:hypothetical protein
MKCFRHFPFHFVFLLSAILLQAQGNKSMPERLVYPGDTKPLIIHADDLGLAHSVHRRSGLKDTVRSWRI